MLRPLLFALACLLPLPAAAQDVGAATRALSAMWRPIAGAATLEAACAGAIQEMDALEAALPPVLTPESLERVRALRGILVVPTEAPDLVYFFPDMTMPWFASGIGVVAVVDEAEGFLGVRDAGGNDIALQLGTGDGHPLLRVRTPQGQVLNFVGCASTAGA